MTKYSNILTLKMHLARGQDPEWNYYVDSFKRTPNVYVLSPSQFCAIAFLQ